MSRKHFNKLAEIVRGLKDRETAKDVAYGLARVCASENNNFNYARFYEACGVEV